MLCTDLNPSAGLCNIACEANEGHVGEADEVDGRCNKDAVEVQPELLRKEVFTFFLNIYCVGISKGSMYTI